MICDRAKFLIKKLFKMKYRDIASIRSTNRITIGKLVKSKKDDSLILDCERHRYNGNQWPKIKYTGGVHELRTVMRQPTRLTTPTRPTTPTRLTCEKLISDIMLRLLFRRHYENWRLFFRRKLCHSKVAVQVLKQIKIVQLYYSASLV